MTNTSEFFHNEKSITSSNHATAYLDGQEYMAEVHKLIKSTKAGDFIYLTGWLFSINQCLLGQKKRKSNLVNMLLDKAAKGVEVKILAWHPSFEAAAVLHNALCHSYLYFKSWELNNPNFKVSLSQTGIHGSHHQKSVMIKSKGKVCALLGGIDMAKDRWDTHAHDMNKDRNSRDFDGWHDIHVKIDGPAAEQVLENFVERWNAKKSKIYVNSIKREVAQVNKNFSDPKAADFYKEFEKLNYTTVKKNLKSIIGNFDLAETLPYISVDSSKIKLAALDYETDGSCDIQINRTISQRSTEKIPHDYSVLAGFQKAINAAQHYIYLEDQYFWQSDTLLKSFVAAAKRGVKIIAVTVMESDQNPGVLRNYHQEARFRLFSRLNKASKSGQAAFLFHLKPLAYIDSETDIEEDRIRYNRKSQIYVHSKLLIIDDNFVSIGSANLNDRSMTYDSELACSIVDTAKSIGPMGVDKKFDKNKFALNLRKRIWAQLLGVPESRLNNPLKANSKGELLPNGWPTTRVPRKHLAELHELSTIKTNKLWYSGKEDLMNPRPVDLKVKYK